MELDADRLKAILGAYSANMLARMAERLGLEMDEFAKKAHLVAGLASFLGTRNHLAKAHRRLTARQWQALAYPRFRTDSVRLGALLVRSRARGATTDVAAAELEDLLLTGAAIFVDQPASNYKLDPTATRIANGEYSDLKVASFPVFVDAAERSGMGDALGWTAESPASIRAGSFADVQRDTFLALRAAEDGIRLTAKGVPYRVDVARLAAAATGKSVRGRGGKTKLSDVVVPSHLWFVLAVLMASDLAEVKDWRLVATPLVRDFLRSPAGVQVAKLQLAWRDCVFSEFFRVPTFELAYDVERDVAWIDGSLELVGSSDIPPLARLRDARRAIVSAIQQGARHSAEWLSFSALTSTVRADEPEYLVPHRTSGYAYSSYSYGGGRRPRVYEGIRRPKAKFPDNQFRRDDDWGEVEGAYIAQVLTEPLLWLGLVDLGFDDAGSLVSFRLTPAGRHALLDEPLGETARAASSSPALVVQPNFELVVLDVSGNLGLVSQLDDFAERVSLDRAATYRLTRGSAVRGMERGQTTQSILDLLERESGTPISQNVRYSLVEWGRLYERIHVRRAATLLAADSTGQLDRWLGVEALAAQLGRRISPTHVLVPTERRAAVEALLEQRGEAPRRVDYSQPARRIVKVSEPAEIALPLRHDEPYVRYRLSRFAERVSATDGRAFFRLTAESIGRAVRSGLTADEIIDYLVGVSGARLPSDTVLRVRGWAGSYRPLGFEAVVAVEAPPGLAWSELRSVPAVREAIRRQVGLSVALVDPEKFESLRAALAERGLSVEPGVGDDGVTAAEQEAAQEPDRFELPGAGSPSGIGVAYRRLVGQSRVGERALEVLVMPDPDSAGAGEWPAGAVPTAGSARGPVSMLRRLRGEDLQRFLAVAVAERRWIVVAVEQNDGAAGALTMRPTRLRRGPGDVFLDAHCDSCGEIHAVPLSIIGAVGDVAQPTPGER